MTRRQYQREWMRRKHGHAPQKRVSDADALGILALLSIGMQQALIARVYGLSQQTVSKIKRR
jgi:hypothetical protein